ncbi:YjgN family protein [Arenimonas sp. MALMAid1274]|uniref:YjgN family protein n=1 Tax=Arenimonas sp. MALMAid1274 TaxID=3411630 RepID=UPI003B9F042B
MQNDALDLVPGAEPPALPPLPPPLPEPPPPPESVRYPIEFTGRAGEFFGIWFVNLVLSVLTLGIYSAWAKVRTERYFYGNTHLAGAPFEYLASPIAILKGRLIAYAVAITLGLCAHFQLFVVYIPLVLAILVLFPWLIQRTLRFRARYSAWRGLRFRFVDGVFEAYVNFMFRPMLQPITLYLTLPWVRMCQHEYVVAGHRFGGKRFSYKGDLGSYFIPFLIVIGLGFGAYLLMIFAAIAGGVAASAMGIESKGPDGAPSDSFMLAVMVPLMVVYLGFLALPVFLRTRYTNLMWKFSALGPHRFESTLRARDVIWIYFSNGVLIVLSVGLLVPWAMIRLARYRAAHFAVHLEGGVDQFVAESERNEAATSAELIDALDLDVDLSI